MSPMFRLVVLLLGLTGGAAALAVDRLASAASASRPTQALFIGNSLTLHPPAPEFGWPNSWGMAASAQAKDFAHIAAATLKLSAVVQNISSLENDPKGSAPAIAVAATKIDARTLVVVELGDNVAADRIADFELAYAQLLEAAQRGRRLLCLSTWWENKVVDAVLQRQCTAHGGRFVAIGDIHRTPTQQDLQGPRFAEPAINAHPHDDGMARIAERVVAAAR